MLYRFKGFDKAARRVLNEAVSTAASFGHAAAGTEHCLLAILREDEGEAAAFLLSRKIYGFRLARLICEEKGQNTPCYLWPGTVNAELRAAMDEAVRTAQAAGEEKASPMHLLAAFLQQECTARQMMEQLGLDAKAEAAECGRRAKAPLWKPAAPHMAPPAPKNVLRYGQDLTQLAREGRLDPVFCREEEIAAVERILLRRRKNAPCLVGEAGVGKTAVVEGLALRIAEGRAPARLCGKSVLSLDIGSLVAGTKYRGDFEQRLHDVLAEVRQAGSAILFLDEVHSIMGAGASEGGVDAASILKPILARGEVQVIGATTREEYAKHIEKDAAMARRFEAVPVEEPSRTAALAILQGLAPRYESYHGVCIEPQALEAAVELTATYMPGRFLPDKAIDALDEACASVKMEERCPPAVGRADVAAAVSRHSGVPAALLCRSRDERLDGLEQALCRHIIGQEEAVHTVAGAMRRARLFPESARRPMASFLFLGPTGVGKTALAKAVARECFGGPQALVRFDMSEYMEKQAAARLVGAPPGYVGHEEGGQLTRAVRERPHCVVLLDEVEKAHPDVMHLLLQVLEEGELTDGLGRRVSFRTALVVLTSNLGARALGGAARPTGFGAGQALFARHDALQSARGHFSPELLARLDECVVFGPLSAGALERIAQRELDETCAQLREAGISLSYEPPVPGALAALAKPELGARALRRLVRTRVLEPLALLEPPGAPARVAVHGGDICVEACGPQPVPAPTAGPAAAGAAVPS